MEKRDCRLLVFNTVKSFHPPLANWLICAVTVTLSVLAWRNSPAFWENLMAQYPSGLSYLTLSPFLHADLGHLFWNMYFLLVFGNAIAGGLGWFRYILLYLGAAACAHVFNIAFTQLSSIGASGAVYGMMGFFIVPLGRAKLKIWLPPIPPFAVPSILFAAAYVGMDLHSLWSPTEGDKTDHWAHLGGFAFGLGVALWMKLRDNR